MRKRKLFIGNREGRESRLPDRNREVASPECGETDAEGTGPPLTQAPRATLLLCKILQQIQKLNEEGKYSSCSPGKGSLSPWLLIGRTEFKLNLEPREMEAFH